MRKSLFAGLTMALTSCGWAQVEQLADTLTFTSASEELAFHQDTLDFIAPFDLEYIPADDTPELIADRLSCLQRTIPLEYNDKVHGFINYFTIKDREYTRMVLRRKDLYFPLFEKYLARYNLPDELKYLSIIESGLNPRATSRARAVGLWQFMSGTGRYFNLHSDWYMDDRMDPEKSTEAACRYLNQLHSIFKNWELALAAYNSGPGTVRKAIRRSGYKKTFWEIYNYLPRETRAYLPQYVAMIYTVNHAEEHNIFEEAKEEMLPHDTLLVKQFLHFETFAKLTGTCLEDLQKLNPAVQRNAIPDGKVFVLRVPLVAKKALDQNRASILDSASKVGRKDLEMLAKITTGSTYGRELVMYQVRNGDALGLIAQRHRVRIEDLKKWNNLQKNLIHPGQRLNIWVLPSTKVTASNSSSKQLLPPSPDSKTYIVQPGDTLWDISNKFQGLTIEKIRNLNNLKTNKLQPGQKLIVG
jgi:membrane-bound lytic murein transglycosylase D